MSKLFLLLLMSFYLLQLFFSFKYSLLSNINILIFLNIHLQFKSKVSSFKYYIELKYYFLKYFYFVWKLSLILIFYELFIVKFLSYSLSSIYLLLLCMWLVIILNAMFCFFLFLSKLWESDLNIRFRLLANLWYEWF